MSHVEFNELFKYLNFDKKKVLLGIVALLITNALGSYIPLLIRNIINQQQLSLNSSTIISNIAKLIILASILWATSILSKVFIFREALNIEFSLRQRIFEHLLALDLSHAEINNSGDLISRATSDTNKIRRSAVFMTLSLTNTASIYLFTLPIMLSISLSMSIPIILFLIILPLTVYFFKEKLYKEQLMVQNSLSEVSNLIQEDISNIFIIKVYAQEMKMHYVFNKLNTHLLNMNLKLSKTQSILSSLLPGVNSLCLLILMWLGTAKIASNTLSIENFIILILYTERLIIPTALVGNIVGMYQAGKVSISRVGQVFISNKRIQEPFNPKTFPQQQAKGMITACCLKYIYPGTTHPALENISFTIKPSETIAIIGPINSGKSTLAKALVRFINIEPDQLFLDGIDIKRLRTQDLRRTFSYVPQDHFLFSTTIKENISYANPQIEQAEVEKAAILSEIHNEITTFPQGYETIVGERGIRLSGGQRQRICLARAILANTPILILDNAFSNIDNLTSTQIIGRLLEFTKHKTVIFISHQLSVAAVTDRIFVMNSGQIVQSGSHSNLLQQFGLYKSLWDLQELTNETRFRSNN